MKWRERDNVYTKSLVQGASGSRAKRAPARRDITLVFVPILNVFQAIT